jgi:hypothetical protein
LTLNQLLVRQPTGTILQQGVKPLNIAKLAVIVTVLILITVAMQMFFGYIMIYTENSASQQAPVLPHFEIK